MKKKVRKRKYNFVLVAGLIVVLLIVGLGVLFYNKNKTISGFATYTPGTVNLDSPITGQASSKCTYPQSYSLNNDLWRVDRQSTISFIKNGFWKNNTDYCSYIDKTDPYYDRNDVVIELNCGGFLVSSKMWRHIQCPKGQVCRSGACVDNTPTKSLSSSTKFGSDLTVPFYRTYNPSTGDHFYTMSETEKNNAVANYGYSDEGIAAYIFDIWEPDTNPLFRTYNPSTGDHFYTTDETEKNNAVANYGYSDEGTAGYIYNSAHGGLVPFYRTYSPSTGDHFYTTNENEKDYAVANYGYTDEGVAGWVYGGINLEGKYTGFYGFPQTFFDGSSLSSNEVVQVTDVIYSLEGELTNGIYPTYSGPINQPDFQKIEYQFDAYGSSGFPMHLGDYASPLNNGGDHSWDVIAHEMSHNFWNDNNFFYTLAVPGPFLQESTSVLTAQYVYERIKQDSNHFSLSKNKVDSLDRVFISEKAYQKSRYDEYIRLGKPYSQDESGPNYAILTSQAFDYKMFLIGDQYGWDKFPRFYKGFSNELKSQFSFWQDGVSDIEETTYTIAALNVAFNQDFRQEFKNLNFPINDTLYNQIYPKIKEFVGKCIYDWDCDDNLSYTKDLCLNSNDHYENGSSASFCYNKPQLVGNRTIKLAVVEFVPQNVKYGVLCLCKKSFGYYFMNSIDYCDNLVSCFTTFDITNNRFGQKSFTNLPSIDQFANIGITSFIDEGEFRLPHSIFYLNSYLGNESKRYGVDVSPQFKIDLKGPFILDDLPPVTNGIVNYSKVDDYFVNKINNKSLNLSGYDYVTVIYFDDSLVSNVDRHSFTSHSTSLNSNFVYIDLRTDLVEDIGLHTLAHELLHKMGASDTYVFGEGPNAPSWCHMFDCCTDPDGIPEPNKVPKYPQTKGCLMCAGGSIVLKYGEEQQSVSSIHQTLICNKTAQEIGWVN
ncbi:MAG: hypothetical protein WC796_02670 [Candidatus Pacearchaeota archaeon]|jgi:hypothetical protein